MRALIKTSWNESSWFDIMKTENEGIWLVSPSQGRKVHFKNLTPEGKKEVLRSIISGTELEVLKAKHREDK